MSSIAVHQILREVRHPAWTPENPDGTAPTAVGTSVVAANGWQPVGTGEADFMQGDSTNHLLFDGDAGQMFTISGHNTGYTQNDVTGDGDDVVQMDDFDVEVPGTRSLSAIQPTKLGWLSKFLHTVANDAMRRPMEVRDTYETGKTVQQAYWISNLAAPTEAKGVLRIEADLTPKGKATETGLM